MPSEKPSRATRVRLDHRIDLFLPAFEHTVPRGLVSQFHFEKREAVDWYANLWARLRSADGYLPLYRMSDGEFVFVFGWRPYPLGALLRYPEITLRSWAKALLRIRTDRFRSGSAGYGFEAYGADEWKAAQYNYGARVKEIADSGILAVNFVSHLHFPTQYHRPMCRWMEQHGISLRTTNYYPFYYVYALLLGPDAAEFFRGRRILVITSDQDGTKARNIERSLRGLGAASFRFVPISRDRSMFDRIDVTGIGDVDLVLIGAGVGALNILEQVRPLGVPSIDAGYVLDCFWQPHRFVGQRAFTLPDRGSPLLLKSSRSDVST